VFAGVIYLVLYGIKTFICAIPDLVEKGIWFIVLILVLIALLGILVGGGGAAHSFPHFF
jgi:hypothetical protein